MDIKQGESGLMISARGEYEVIGLEGVGVHEKRSLVTHGIAHTDKSICLFIPRSYSRLQITANKKHFTLILKPRIFMNVLNDGWTKKKKSEHWFISDSFEDLRMEKNLSENQSDDVGFGNDSEIVREEKDNLEKILFLCAMVLIVVLAVVVSFYVCFNEFRKRRLESERVPDLLRQDLSDDQGSETNDCDNPMTFKELLKKDDTVEKRKKRPSASQENLVDKKMVRFNLKNPLVPSN